MNTPARSTTARRPDLLSSIWLGRLPVEDRPSAAAALDAWLSFRDASRKVLSRELALAFRRSLGVASDAEASYATVAEFHEWLVDTGINSSNPFRPATRR